MKRRSSQSLELEKYFDRLWPICRSILGPGYRESLQILSEVMPMERLRFKTGQRVFDWKIPQEWRPKRAFFVDPKGRRRAEFSRNNLHLLNYSAPFRGKLPLDELQQHLYSLPEMPDAIPYLTSYYRRRWGFCLSHRERQRLPKGNYEVVIDTEFKDGALEIGEAVLPGKTDEEILFSSYLCHPSLANNELSGPLALVFLYRRLAAMPNRRYTYRFAIMPETIGAVAYLVRRGSHLKRRLAAGYQITCVGDPGPFTYKTCREPGTLADRVALEVLKGLGRHTVVPFHPAFGSDERQYASPGFNLPVGSLMRTMYGRYREYHTSLDDKSFIRFEALSGSVDAYVEMARALEANRVWKTTVPHGVPMLGKRGLYPTLGSQRDCDKKVEEMMWLLNFADGTRDLVGIAERSGQPLGDLIPLSRELADAGLLKEVQPKEVRRRL